MNHLSRLLCILGLASAAHGDELALHEGDCWLYRTRPGEEASFLVIRKLAQIPGTGEIAHISVFRLHIKSPPSPGGYTDEIGHLPISVKSLRESLTRKAQETPPQSDWRAGYDSWKEAKGGAFTEPVSKCVQFVEEALTHGHAEA